MTAIAPYVFLEEFRCHHCSQLPPDLIPNPAMQYPIPFQTLFNHFRAIREKWGAAIPITSGYRCPVHEKEVSGSNIGPHILGLALDLAIGLADQPRFIALIEADHAELRMGVNRNPGAVHIHLDCAFLAFPRWTADFVRNARWIE